MRSPIELSIIIVEYKSGGYLKKLLDTLPTRKDWEVIVIDNSIDNIGYGAGCNLGASQAKGKYLLFLNPDVLIDEKNIEKMVKHLRTHPEVGVVGPRFINAKNETEHSSADLPTPGVAAVAFSFLNSLFPKNSTSRRYWMRRWNRDTVETVGVVSGAAMMVRAKEFEIVGKFDPSFFLYWEEFDLCKRMKDYHRSSVFLATAVAKHPQKTSMKQANVDTDLIFAQSRRKYFAKHFGVVRMALLEMWLFIGEQWRALSLLVLSLFFRTVMIDRIHVIGDLGRDYFEALKMVRFESFPIMGIPSSIPRFSQGPLNTWFDALSFALGGTTLFAPVLFSALLTSFGVVLLYLLLEKRVGRNFAFVAGLVLALSPAAIQQSRMPFYLFAEPTFLVIYLWRLTRLKSQSTTAVFWASLTFWILFQWELATIPLAILLPIAFWRNRIPWRGWFVVIPATILGLFPQMIYDLTHRCAQLCGLVAWTGYRAVAVSGFDGKHGYSPEKFAQFFQQLWKQTSNLVSVHPLAAILSTTIIIYALYILFKNRKSLDALVLYSLSGAAIILLGIFVHGSPSEAYFPPFLVFIPIIIAYALKLVKKDVRVGVVAVVLLLSMFNGVQLLRHNFYAESAHNYISASKWIVRDAKGQAVNVKSLDSAAGFESYLDHLRFLVLSHGGSIEASGVPYYISLEDQSTLPTGMRGVEFPKLFVGRGVE